MKIQLFSREILSRRKPVIDALSLSLNLRDPSTGAHSQRVARLSYELAQDLGLPALQCEKVREAGLLHDIGKLAVQESVLFKPERLNEEEWKIMRSHPAQGAKILAELPVADLGAAVVQHHERWDGQGYPLGLRRDEICLEARILALADAYDAMISARCYRGGQPAYWTLDQIEQGQGRQFDPELAGCFVRMQKNRRR